MTAAPPSRKQPPAGWQLRLWLWLRRGAQPLMRQVLQRRLARGREDPARIGEKLGQPGLPRPEIAPGGQLIWLHAVGLGEVLALRPLITAMQAQEPELRFLITSTARSSAGVIANNQPPGAVHQFLPLDGPDFMARFLDHWRPALSVWSEQDLWPGAVCDIWQRGIPLAWINVRLHAQSLRRRRRLGGLYRDVMARFALIEAQDPLSAASLRSLGGPAAELVREGRSLKPAAEPLQADPETLARLRKALTGRRIITAASTHAEDEALLLPAFREVARQDPTALLLLVPRLPARGDEIAAALQGAGLSHVRRSKEAPCGPEIHSGIQVLLADSFGELGLWYRLADTVYIGGSMGGTGGHNPWEAVCLGHAVLHGPQVHNFTRDYNDLRAAGLATEIPEGNVAQFAGLLLAPPGDAADRAATLVTEARAALTPLARDLLALARRPL